MDEVRAEIAKQERELGNYKIAHYTLYQTMHEMEAHGSRVPSDLRKAFLLLHSYVLVKKLVKQGNHMVRAVACLLRSLCFCRWCYWMQGSGCGRSASGVNMA